MADIFLSYKREDREKVRPLVDALQARGRTVWWDSRIGAGETWDQVIEAELRAAKCVLVIWSKRSIESDWVRAEAHDARDRRCLIPIIIENVTPPSIFKMLQATDLSAWAGDRDDPNFAHVCAGIDRLLRQADVIAAEAVPVMPEPVAPAETISPATPAVTVAAKPESTHSDPTVCIAAPVTVVSLPEHARPSDVTANHAAQPPPGFPWQMLAIAAAALLIGVGSTYFVLSTRLPPPSPTVSLQAAVEPQPAPSAVLSPQETPKPVSVEVGSLPDARSAPAAVGESKPAAAILPPKPNENDQVIEAQTKIIDKDRRNADAYVTRGIAYLNKGELDIAISDFNTAAQLSPRNAATFLHRGLAYRRKGDNKRASAEYARALDINSNYAEAYSYRGYLKNAEEDFESARADFDKAIRLNNAYGEAYAGRAAAMHGLKDYEAALRDYNKAIEIEPRNARYFNGRGVIYHDRAYLRTKSADDFRKAIDDYSKAIEIDAKFASAFRNRGFTRRVTNDLDGAIEDYTIALSLNPKLTDVMSRRGYAYELRAKPGDRDRAEADYLDAIKIDPTFEPAKRNLKDLRDKK